MLVKNKVYIDCIGRIIKMMWSELTWTLKVLYVSCRSDQINQVFDCKRMRKVDILCTTVGMNLLNLAVNSTKLFRFQGWKLLSLKRINLLKKLCSLRKRRCWNSTDHAPWKNKEKAMAHGRPRVMARHLSDKYASRNLIIFSSRIFS